MTVDKKLVCHNTSHSGMIITGSKPFQEATAVQQQGHQTNHWKQTAFLWEERKTAHPRKAFRLGDQKYFTKPTTTTIQEDDKTS